MRLGEWRRLGRLGKRWWRGMQRQAVILVYHRVVALDPDPLPIGVSPQNFAEHLAVIRRFYRPLHLQGLVFCLEEGKLPERTVVLTFDDGYADNLYQAKPLLERYGVPATVFVTTGAMGQQQEFWWDELDRLLLQPGELPGKLHLAIGGEAYQWELGEGAHYSQAAYQRHRSWNTLRPENPTSRHELYRSLHRLLYRFGEAERQCALEQLRIWAGTRGECRQSHRTLSPNEVVDLA